MSKTSNKKSAKSTERESDKKGNNNSPAIHTYFNFVKEADKNKHLQTESKSLTARNHNKNASNSNLPASPLESNDINTEMVKGQKGSQSKKATVKGKETMGFMTQSSRQVKEKEKLGFKTGFEVKEENVVNKAISTQKPKLPPRTLNERELQIDADKRKGDYMTAIIEKATQKPPPQITYKPDLAKPDFTKFPKEWLDLDEYSLRKKVPKEDLVDFEAIPIALAKMNDFERLLYDFKVECGYGLYMLHGPKKHWRKDYFYIPN